MRIRSIKPEFFDDEELSGLDPITRLLYIGLWCVSDDEGRLRLHPMYLRGKLFPYADIDLQPHINSLKDHGKLIEYSVRAQTYGFLPNFLTHQRINRPSKSKLPKPPPNGAPQSLTEDSVNPHGGLTIGKERNLKHSARVRTRETCAFAKDLLELWNESSGQSRRLKAFQKHVAPRVSDGFSEGDLRCVIAWVFNSDHKQAAYLRDNGFDRPSTVFRSSKFEDYLELAKGVKAPKPSGPLPIIEFADGEQVWD